MSRAVAFLTGAAIATLGIYAAFTWIEHVRNFDNQEEFA
jgi:hypothetical protein